jgi:hypothetical protein
MMRATLNKLCISLELPMLELHDCNATQQFTNQLITPVVYQTKEDHIVGKTHFKETELFRVFNSTVNSKLFDMQKNESKAQEGAGIFALKGFWARCSKDSVYVEQNQTIVPRF